MWIAIAAAVIAIPALFLIVLYNRFVSLRNLTAEAFSGIDAQLKMRTDLIPNLVETVKGYAKHERGALEEVTRLRTACSEAVTLGERSRAESAMSRAISGIFAVAEAYPDLKASANFAALQTSLADIENQLQLARRYYNGSVRNFNTAIQTFPGNVVAGMFGFTAAEFFGLDDPADRLRPQVQF